MNKSVITLSIAIMCILTLIITCGYILYQTQNNEETIELQNESSSNYIESGLKINGNGQIGNATVKLIKLNRTINYPKGNYFIINYNLTEYIRVSFNDTIYSKPIIIQINTSICKQTICNQTTSSFKCWRCE